MRAGKAPGFRPSTPRRYGAWLVLVVLVMISLAAHADYKDNYARGLEAYKSGRYPEARQLFTQARDEHPEPAVRIKLYGQRYEPYLPQHYLGLIDIQSGNCAGGLAQWSSSGNPEVVAQLGDLANEEKSASSKCGAVAQAKPSAPTPAPAPAAPKPAETPTSVAQKPAAAPPSVPEVTKPAVPDAAAVAAAAAQSKASQTVDSKPPAAPQRPVEKTVVADKAGPPDQLVQAFENFLNGRLAEVSRINPDAYSEAQVRFHAYLVRCGARYTLAQLNGDQAQLDTARADARSAHAINAAAAPDPVLFSPRFRSFYAENR